MKGPATVKHPAEDLEGRTLPDGFVVQERLSTTEDHTGGSFSVCYLATKEGQDLFVKATDLTFYGTDSEDLAVRLERVLSIYNFEKLLLEIARLHAMSRIVSVVAAGQIPVDVGGLPIPVFYLVFERADGNLRERLMEDAPMEPIDRLRALRQVATGLNQLHTRGIAHQDLKPSNVVNYGKHGDGLDNKITDLGRGSHREHRAIHDRAACAGDKRYAPLELLYEQPASGFDRRRLGADAYLLGSLIAQVFSGVTITQAVLAKLPETHQPKRWGDGYPQLLPRLREAFDAVVLELRASWPYPSEDPKIAEQLDLAIRQLCDPDPSLRGHPGAAASVNPLDMQRYISVLDMLVHRASLAERTKARNLAALIAAQEKAASA
ncbi:MAG TPA: hypothetical protein VE866_09785 [Candidatus Binatia bacterium]|jgi:serine/threonine protein kinase|nr:hypothetical protein [Candidatus Binatia bacterium]